MTFNEYQTAAMRTAIYPPGLTYPVLGLAGEAGEVANKFAKAVRDCGGELDFERREALADEVGDVLWMAAAIASELDISLEDIAANNIRKLAARAAKGTIGGEGDKR